MRGNHEARYGLGTQPSARNQASEKPVLYIGDLLSADRVNGADQSTIEIHLKLLIEAGLIDANQKQGISTVGGWYVRRLTWDGHEFLDTIRDPEIWRKTKEGASAAGSWSIGAIKEIGTALLKAKVQSVLGIELG
jgi:DNA-binding transcriptional ArsR family regulator